VRRYCGLGEDEYSPALKRQKGMLTNASSDRAGAILRFDPPEEDADTVALDSVAIAADGELDDETRSDAADVSAAFFADVAATSRLDRDEETRLAREIAARRSQIMGLLHGQRRLVQAALSAAGRSLVHPDDDFREREALMVLHEAQVRARHAASPEQRKRFDRFSRRLEVALAAYRGLRNQMITANIRLVAMVARRYRHPTLSLLDLIQEGTLGLVRAVEKFEPSRNIRFSTYAVWWIWQQIARAADCQGATIRTPVHWNQLRRKLGRSTVDGRDDEHERLASEENLSPACLAAIAQGVQCVSLATPIGADDERTLESALPAPTECEPEHQAGGRQLADLMAAALTELPEREATILRLRFGMSGAGDETLDEIGSRFGVSRERIRQLEARALQQMRAICERDGLGEMLH
jgi:RNA polymerase primary sigma factor